MNQPPLLKTRRSNAVHSRRLAVHVSLLERHLAALEADRARAVRALQEELSHLHVIHRPPPLSPHRTEQDVPIGGSLDRNILDRSSTTQAQKSFPPLERSAASETRATARLLLPLPPSQQKRSLSDTHKGLLLPSITSGRDSSKNDDNNIVTNQSSREDHASKLPEASTPRFETSPSSSSSRSEMAGSGRNVKRNVVQDGGESHSEQHTTIEHGGSRRSGSTDVSPRESKSLPPVSHGNLSTTKGQDHRHRASKNEGTVVLKGDDNNMSTGQSNGKTKVPESCEGLSESTSPAHPAEVKAGIHQDSAGSGEPESRSNIRKTHKTHNKRESPFSNETKESRHSGEVSAQPTSTGEHQHHQQPKREANGTKSPPCHQRPGSRSLDMERRHHRGHSAARESNRKNARRCHLALACSERCGHFPCTRPPTYHSLGFYPDPSTQLWPLWLRQNARRPLHRLHGQFSSSSPSLSRDIHCGEEEAVSQSADDSALITPPPTTTTTTTRTTTRRRLGKEEVVRLDMARKKRQVALDRPPSWNTNYGRPTPYKRLNYPARIKPLM